MEKLKVGDLVLHKTFEEVQVIVSERTTPSGRKEFKLSGEPYYVSAQAIQKVFLLLNR